MKISIVIVTYRRLERLEEILSAWLKETPDVWLCDCSKEGFKTNLPIKIIRAISDPGNKIRHAIALMTEGDIVIKADDDIIPLPGLAEDFANHMNRLGPAILGVHGRTFHGRSYYNSTQLYHAKQLKEPEPVDFVGVITCSSRDFLAFDLMGCKTAVEDLFWQMKCFPHAMKYIIPTDKFHNLQESRDKGRLATNPQARQIRQRFYLEYYVKNYQRPDGLC